MPYQNKNTQNGGFKTIELSREQFINEIGALNEKGRKFNVESVDGGSVYFAFADCDISVELENGACVGISIFKPNTLMEADIDFEIVDNVTKDDDGSFTLEFNNGMADVTIIPVA